MLDGLAVMGARWWDGKEGFTDAIETGDPLRPVSVLYRRGNMGMWYDGMTLGDAAETALAHYPKPAG